MADFESLSRFLGREEYLALLIARVALNPSPASFQKLQHASQGKWREKPFLRLVRDNRLMYLLSQVKQQFGSFLPVNTQKKVEAMVFNHRFRDRLLRAEFIEVLTSLQKNHRQFVMLKNQFLEKSVLGQEFVKPMYDMDLLFDEEAEYWRQATVLFRHHYHAKTQHRGGQVITNLKMLKTLPVVSQNLFEKDDLKIENLQYCIELHPQVVDTFSYRATPLNARKNRQLTKDIFEHTSVRKVNGLSLLYPASHYHLLILILHSIVQHNAQGLITVWEVAAFMLRADDIDWTAFAAIVKKYGLTKYVAWYLELIEILFPNALIQITDSTFQTQFNPHTHQASLIKRPFLWWMVYKVFHHTDFMAGEREERQKWLSWKIIEW